MSDLTSASSANYLLLTQLADEFAARYRAGQRPSIQEYTDRYPHLADDIRELFPTMVEMEQVKDDHEDAERKGPAAPTIRQLGDFRILREVGKGGMGIVYEAEQVSLGRHVALKVLPKNMLLDAKAKQRFEREAKSAARLHHTNIVPVFGVGEQDGMPYYVMQFIQGLGLDEVIDELKKLQQGGARFGSRGYSDLRVSGHAEQPFDLYDQDTEPKNATKGAVSAVSVARSLLTGRFQPEPVLDGDDTAALGSEETANQMTGTETARAPSSSGSFTLSSSSVTLPGQSRDTSKSRSKKRNYWQSVALIGVQVAEAMEYAHKQGIHHRDIKPSNLLLDAQATVWVTDFGLAKADDQQNLTHTGDILGTLRYMPPEAFEGKTDARSDVYSLGLTLFEMLAFRAAFNEKDRNRLIRQVTDAEPDRLMKINPQVPQDLETIIHKAIDKDPARRYATAAALANDLQRFIDDEPILARRASQVERLGRWSRRHKAVAALLITLATVLSVGFVVMAVLWSEARDQAKKATKLAKGEMEARAQAQALAAQEKEARGEAQLQEHLAIEKAELLAREDYINRVNRAYREVQDDNVALAEDLLHGCEIKRRGWEWSFVERLCNSERRVVSIGNSGVNAIAFSPDGNWAVSGSGALIMGGATDEATTVKVWDVGSGQPRKTLTGAKGTVFDVAVRPDGKTVAAGFSDGLVMVWDVETGQSVWAHHEPGLNAMSLSFSRDGKSLAVGYGLYSGNLVGRVKIWDAVSGKELRAFKGPTGGVNKVAFDPDGKRLAIAGSDVVEVWDVDTVRKLKELQGHKKWVYCLAYSPDGKWLATGGWDRTVKLWDAATGALALTIFAHEGFVLNLAFSPDSRELVTASEDRSARLWQVPSGRRLATFHGHTDFVQTVAFRPDSREVATGSMDGSIRFWDMKTSRPVVVEHLGWVEQLAFRRDGLRVLSLSELDHYGSNSLATKGWSPLTGELDTALEKIKFDALPEEFVAEPRYPLITAMSPDAKLLATAVGNGGGSGASRSKEYSLSSVIVREARTGKILHSLTGHSADVVSLAFSPDSRRLASASYDRTVKLWDMQSGQAVFTLLGHTAGVVSVAFSPDGTQIVTGGIDWTARVWNAMPLAHGVTAQHDTRYQLKVETLAKLKTATDDNERAKILVASGQWSVAAEIFASIVAKEPGSLEARYQLIDALLKASDTKRAALACDEMLARFGKSGTPLQVMAVAGFCRLARTAAQDHSKQPAVHELFTAKTDDERTLILARQGQWDLIYQCTTRIVEAQPRDWSAHYWQVLSLLESGNLAGYRLATKDLISRFQNDPDPSALNNAAWWCAYTPNAVADLGVPVKMAEAALARYPADQKRFALNTLGATLYRDGQIDEAIKRLDESVRTSGGAGVPQDWAFLAMAHHKKGHVEEARRWLEKVRAYIKDEKTPFSSDLVETRYLLKEAAALVGGDASSRP